jgi:dTDP-4-amino-4,6-dideoxygalactose transaminase
MFEKILEFEHALAEFTGAPYAISTDCCTHAIELCLIYDQVTDCKITPFTYLSIPMTLHKLNINYEYLDHEWQRWVGEYPILGTRIWDSARLLKPNMYRSGSIQCLSFGHGKPLNNNRGGAILLDDKESYDSLIKMRYDGRDLSVSPWIEQSEFKLGFHYKLNPEECVSALTKLIQYQESNKYEPIYVEYPDCRRIKIVK